MLRQFVLVAVLLASCSRPTLALKSLGVDLGTSGVRATVVDGRGTVVGEAATAWTDAEGREPQTWLRALRETLARCPGASEATRIAVSGTSASILVVDASGRVSRGPAMYSDSASKGINPIERFAPAGHTTRSSTSALAKLVAWHAESPVSPTERCAHQADFVSAALAAGYSSREDDDVRLGEGFCVKSDWHNALKLGFDVEALRWPAWMTDELFSEIELPPECLMRDVLEPGAPAHTVSAAAAAQWGLREGACLVGGTTDSIAAFLACSFSDGRLRVEPGAAVTSLGSTTAVKLVSDTKVDDAARGVYSHRLGDAWLVGGASNAGTKVLRKFDFSDGELAALSAEEDLFDDLDDLLQDDEVCYPLCDVGERFPVNDPNLAPRLPDRVDRLPAESDADYAARRHHLLRSLLVGIAHVERRGYAALADLGATRLDSLASAGGGAKNAPWRLFRSRLLGVPVLQAPHTDAAFGAAVLALPSHGDYGESGIA